MCECAQKCGYCGKLVRNKVILGTLHFCLTEEERRIKDRMDQRAMWQLQQQRTVIGGYSGQR